MKHATSLKRFGLVALALLVAACSPVTSTPAPTTVATLVPPTATIAPVATASAEDTEALAGWKKFEGAMFELALPESFEGGSTPSELAQVAQNFRDAGQEELARAVETRPHSAVFYALDSNLVPSHIATVVTGFRDQGSQFSTMSIDDYIARYAAAIQQQPGLTLLESKATSIPGFQAHLLVYQIDTTQVVVQGTQGTVQADEYTLKAGDTIWSIIYSTDISEYETRHADFQKSVLSFKYVH